MEDGAPDVDGEDGEGAIAGEWSIFHEPRESSKCI